MCVNVFFYFEVVGNLIPHIAKEKAKQHPTAFVYLAVMKREGKKMANMNKGCAIVVVPFSACLIINSGDCDAVLETSDRDAVKLASPLWNTVEPLDHHYHNVHHYPRTWLTGQTFKVLMWFRPDT